MSKRKDLEVAILLPSYNGERYVEEQLRSLKRNNTKFTLQWLDDHSTDDTRRIVRSVARDTGIELREWHQPQRLGVPTVFFELLECVQADIYLFCDQDDIWQPGKIDATVENLLCDLDSPAMVFTDPLIFKDGEPDRQYRVLELLKVDVQVALQESRMFMTMIGYGHTQGFTRALRDLYMKHKEIARTHAYMHDAWMYGIAVASGTVRLLPNAPTTLYRLHARNSSEGLGSWTGNGTPRLTTTWTQLQLLRRLNSRHAEGFILASATLPQSSKLDRILAIARLITTLHKRQSPSAVIRLVRLGAIWPDARTAVGLAAACLCSEARP